MFLRRPQTNAFYSQNSELVVFRQGQGDAVLDLSNSKVPPVRSVPGNCTPASSWCRTAVTLRCRSGTVPMYTGPP